ncbi:MAG: sulfatase [Akkermansiaceae bacterium]|nr:sulfatase [Akkermansiaceae bacterium]MDG2322147.1 sulfatase [Akkermansiaceae bacterium]
MKSLHLRSVASAIVIFAAPIHAAAKPNVLFIAIDDLNDWIGCLGGHPQALTPNIDLLAARGILFTNAHCAAPACKPSRAAVFSGRMPNETGVWSNRTKSLAQLQPKIVKLPQAFAQAGYRTLGTGKLHHSSKSEDSFSEYFKTEQRWGPITRKEADYTEADLPSKGSGNPRHLANDSTGRKIILPLNRMPSDRAPDKKSGESFDWGPWDVPDSDFGDTKITNWAISKLREKKDKPLFLAIGYYRPHIPLWAPRRFFERFKDNPGKLPPFRKDDLSDLDEIGKLRALEADTAGLHKTVVENKQWQKAIEAYLACITYIDHEVGRVLDELDRSPYRDNTTIVLWSDHGWHLGEKQHWGKWTGWERSTRVPLIIVPPKNQAEAFAKPGSTCDQPVGLIDLYPTLIDLANVPAPKNLSGQSLVPLLKNPAKESKRKLVTMFNPGNVSVRTKKWRYIRYEDGSEELYHMKDDPNEWANLASDPAHQAIIKELRGATN